MDDNRVRWVLEKAAAALSLSEDEVRQWLDTDAANADGTDAGAGAEELAELLEQPAAALFVFTRELVLEEVPGECRFACLPALLSFLAFFFLFAFFRLSLSSFFLAFFLLCFSFAFLLDFPSLKGEQR